MDFKYSEDHVVFGEKIDGDIVIIGVDEGIEVGYITLDTQQDPIHSQYTYSSIGFVKVLQKYRGRGYGKQLMKYAMSCFLDTELVLVYPISFASEAIVKKLKETDKRIVTRRHNICVRLGLNDTFIDEIV